MKQYRPLGVYYCPMNNIMGVFVGYRGVTPYFYSDEELTLPKTRWTYIGEL